MVNQIRSAWRVREATILAARCGAGPMTGGEMSSCAWMPARAGGERKPTCAAAYGPKSLLFTFAAGASAGAEEAS
jgi:hypothetical protein